MSHYQTCEHCKGSGQARASSLTCHVCNGVGYYCQACCDAEFDTCSQCKPKNKTTMQPGSNVTCHVPIELREIDPETYEEIESESEVKNDEERLPVSRPEYLIPA